MKTSCALVPRRFYASGGISGRAAGGGYAGTSLDAIRQMASMGGSVAVLPSLYAISEAKRDPGLIVRKIDHATAQRQIALVWRETSPMAEKFSKIAAVFSGVATQIMA